MQVFKIRTLKFLYILIFLLVLLFYSGCQNGVSVIPSEPGVILPSCSMIIEGGAEMTKDCTPALLVFADNARYMSFSGNGTEWSEWVGFSQYYDRFNIASGTRGTTMTSGVKTVYVRFKDEEDYVFADDQQEAVYSTIQYEMQKLFSLQIEPKEAEVGIGGSKDFLVRGYDLYWNEVPLEGNKVEWSKPCDTGKLNPTIGLQTVYTAPELPGPRNISAHYGSLGAGAKIFVFLKETDTE